MKKFRLLFLSIILCLPLLFAGCSNSKKNSLQTPSIVDVDNGTIIFSQVENADYYTILLNNIDIIVDHNYNNNVELIDNTIHYNASDIMIDGIVYSIKVQANSSEKPDSGFSTSFTYQHGEDIESPANLKISNGRLGWDNVALASYYIVKVISPSDSVIFDKLGNLISLNSSSDIAAAAIPEFVCNQNYFSITDFVTEPGEYNFYVASVFSQGGKTSCSDFTEKQSYIHSAQLTAPEKLTLNKVNNSTYLSCVIDENANAISIKSGATEKTVELNGSVSSIDKLADNCLQINLNEYFAEQISNSSFNLNSADYFEVQSKYISNTNKYYSNSQYSSIKNIQHKQNFVAPELRLSFSQDLNKYIASWTNPNSEISSYSLVLFGADCEIHTIPLSATSNSLIIEQDFISMAIRVNANNNFEQSTFSNFVSKNNIASSTAITECLTSANSLFWNSVPNAYYVVEIDNDYIVCVNNSTTYTTAPSLACNIVVTAIIEEHCHSSKSFVISSITQLATPTILSSNNNTIAISPVSNAYGYCVYVKKSNNEFEPINHIFTSEYIDLSNHLTNANYEVKIQAVAAPFTAYQNSELSDSVIISTKKAHITPSFVSVNGVETPIFKIVENNTEKYILKFQGVKNTSKYEVSVNQTTFTVNADTTNEQKIYERDVTSILTSAGKYTVKIKAIPVSGSNLLDSDVNEKEYILKQKISSVVGLELNNSNNQKTLKFNSVENAESYLIRIVKEGDPDYNSKLQQLGLSSSFTTSGPADVTDLLTEAGTYHCYIIAQAGLNNEFLYDSDEVKIVVTIE